MAIEEQTCRVSPLSSHSLLVVSLSLMLDYLIMSPVTFPPCGFFLAGASPCFSSYPCFHLFLVLSSQLVSSFTCSSSVWSLL